MDAQIRKPIIRKKSSRGRPFKSKNSMHDLDGVKCRECNKVLKLQRKENFLDHFGIHASRRRYTCTGCPQSFNQIAGFTYHQKNCEGTKIDNLDVALLREWMVAAERCFPLHKKMLVSYLTRKAESLLRRDNKLPPLRPLHSRGGRKSKVTVWDDEKAVRCSACTLTIALSEGRNLRPLVGHATAHDRVKRYQCSECPYSNARLHMIKEHFPKKHNGRGYFVDSMSPEYLDNLSKMAAICFPTFADRFEVYFEEKMNDFLTSRHVDPNGPTTIDSRFLNRHNYRDTFADVEDDAGDTEDGFDQSDRALSTVFDFLSQKTSACIDDEPSTSALLTDAEDQLRAINSRIIKGEIGGNLSVSPGEPLSIDFLNSLNTYDGQSTGLDFMSPEESLDFEARDIGDASEAINGVALPTDSPTASRTSTSNGFREAPMKSESTSSHQLLLPKEEPSSTRVNHLIIPRPQVSNESTAYQDLLVKYNRLKEENEQLNEDNAMYISKIGDQSAEIYGMSIKIEKLKRRLAKYEPGFNAC